MARLAEIEIRLVDRARAVAARVNAMPSEPEAGNVMDDDSGLGPDLMPYESGRSTKKRVKLAAVRLISSGNRAAAKRNKHIGRRYG